MGDGRCCAFGDGDGVSKEHPMNTARTDTHIQNPEVIATPNCHGQAIRVKFYPGLGYAPCILQAIPERENHLKIT